MPKIYKNRVFDSSDQPVFWLTPTPDSLGTYYPGGGTFGVDTSDYSCLEFVTDEDDISVKHFGAVGDGTTDDTVAITNAISSIESTTSGRVLKFPIGTYYISSSVTCAYSIPRFEEGTIIKDNGDAGVVFTANVLIAANDFHFTLTGAGSSTSISTIYKSPDTDAIHDNIPGEINSITEKATPVSADIILIEDSADSNNKKRVLIGNLPGGSVDGRGFAIVIGNSAAGDTSAICDYLDVGDGVQLKAGIEAAAGAPVFIRPGTYDFNNGGATSNLITIPIGTKVEGAGIDAVNIRVLDAATEGKLFVMQGDGTVLREFTISVPTPTALVTSAGAEALIESTASSGKMGLESVRVVYEDSGWSTLADVNYNGMNYMVYQGSNPGAREFFIRNCDFIGIPNYKSTPALEQTSIQPMYGQGGSFFKIKGNYIEGGDLGFELEGKVIFKGNIMAQAWYTWALRMLSGTWPAYILGNDIEIVMPTGNPSSDVVLVFSAAVISGNSFLLQDNASTNATAISVSSFGWVSISENHFWSGSHEWQNVIGFGSSCEGGVVGNHFGSTGYGISGSISNVYFEGNFPNDLSTSIHENVAGEINSITEKASPVSADLILIEDSENSNNKKKIQIGNLPGDVREANIVIGNSANGDTSAVCDALDTGNGTLLKSTIEGASSGDLIFVRAGTYDLGAGPQTRITIPAGVRVVCAGRGRTIVKTSAGADGRAFRITDGCLEDLTIEAPAPTGQSVVGDVVEVDTTFGALKRVQVDFTGAWELVSLGNVTIVAAFGFSNADLEMEDLAATGMSRGNDWQPFGSAAAAQQLGFQVANCTGTLRHLKTTQGYLAYSFDNCTVRVNDLYANGHWDLGLYISDCDRSVFNVGYIQGDFPPDFTLPASYHDAIQLNSTDRAKLMNFTGDSIPLGGGPVAGHGINVTGSQRNIIVQNDFGTTYGVSAGALGCILLDVTCDRNFVHQNLVRTGGVVDNGTLNDVAHNIV